jgi:hypothetical protein
MSVALTGNYEVQHKIPGHKETSPSKSADVTQAPTPIVRSLSALNGIFSSIHVPDKKSFHAIDNMERCLDCVKPLDKEVLLQAIANSPESSELREIVRETSKTLADLQINLQNLPPLVPPDLLFSCEDTSVEELYGTKNKPNP